MRKILTYKGFFLVIVLLGRGDMLLASGVALATLEQSNQVRRTSSPMHSLSGIDSVSAGSSDSDVASISSSDVESVSSSESEGERKSEYVDFPTRAWRTFNSDLFTDKERLNVLLAWARQPLLIPGGLPDFDEVLEASVHVIRSEKPLSLEQYLYHILFSKADADSDEYSQDPALLFRYFCFTNIYWPYHRKKTVTAVDIQHYFAALVAKGCISADQAHFLKSYEPWKKDCERLHHDMTAQKCGEILEDPSVDMRDKHAALTTLQWFNPSSYLFFRRKVLDAVVTASELHRDPTLQVRFMVYEHMLKPGTAYSQEVVLGEWMRRGALTSEQRDRVLASLDEQAEEG